MGPPIHFKDVLPGLKLPLWGCGNCGDSGNWASRTRRRTPAAGQRRRRPSQLPGKGRPRSAARATGTEEGSVFKARGSVVHPAEGMNSRWSAPKPCSRRWPHSRKVERPAQEEGVEAQQRQSSEASARCCSFARSTASITPPRPSRKDFDEEHPLSALAARYRVENQRAKVQKLVTMVEQIKTQQKELEEELAKAEESLATA